MKGENMDIGNILVKEFQLKPFQVHNTIELIDQGNTIPFIARYRKEQTGNLQDTVLREFHQRLNYLRSLEERQLEVIRLIEEQGKLTEELKGGDILSAVTLQRVEDLYSPIGQREELEPLLLRKRV